MQFDPMRNYDYGRFEVVNRVDVLDLSSRTAVPAHLSSERVSPEVRTSIWTFRRTRASDDLIVIEMFTSCLRLTNGYFRPPADMVCLDRYQASFKELPHNPPPSGQNLAKYGLFIDVSDAPVDESFDLHIRTISWNGYTQESEEWTSLNVKYPTRMASLLVHLPRDKPAKAVVAKQHSHADKRLEPYSGLKKPELSEDKLNIRWTIDQPANGKSYRVYWTW